MMNTDKNRGRREPPQLFLFSYDSYDSPLMLAQGPYIWDAMTSSRRWERGDDIVSARTQYHLGGRAADG